MANGEAKTAGAKQRIKFCRLGCRLLLDSSQLQAYLPLLCARRRSHLCSALFATAQAQATRATCLRLVAGSRRFCARGVWAIFCCWSV